MGADFILGFSGKAYNKKVDIMTAIGDAIALKIGVKDKIDNTGNNVEINNSDLDIHIDKNKGQVGFYFMQYNAGGD